MIELMLEAERALAVGILDRAERLYAQVAAADPKNAIAVVGLARVALERGNERGALLLARRALALDPENPMAGHLAVRMSEILRGRGEDVPSVGGTTMPSTETPTTSPPSDAATTPMQADTAITIPEKPAAPPRTGLLGRFLRRRR